MVQYSQPLRRRSAAASEVSPLTVRFAEDLEERGRRSNAPSPSPTLLARRRPTGSQAPRMSERRTSTQPSRSVSRQPIRSTPKFSTASSDDEEATDLDISDTTDSDVSDAPDVTLPKPRWDFVFRRTFGPKGGARHRPAAPQGGPDWKTALRNTFGPSKVYKTKKSDWGAALAATFGPPAITNPATQDRRRATSKDLQEEPELASQAQREGVPLLMLSSWSLVGIALAVLAFSWVA